jgi:hypothetical protein
LQVGGGVYNATSTNGYLSNVRIVNGTAVYTSAFDPPNGPLQAITNTSLLTCAYSTFRDGSTNNFTITVNGNTAVSTQNPFPLTTLPNPALGNQGNGVYSMSQYQSLLSQNLWPAVDPYWRYVTLMLHGNGTNGAQNNTFLDSSTNNFTITRNGNTTQGTFSPFGSNWSNYFDGASYISVPDNAAFTMGSGDFSVECWYFPTSSARQILVAQSNSAGQTTSISFLLEKNASDQLRIVVASGSTAYIATSTSTISLNVWSFIQMIRSGNTLYGYVNGVQFCSVSVTGVSINDSTDIVSIGGNYISLPVYGYLSNVRIVKGTAVSAGVPTSPLTAISGTSLLTCQSNRFIDNSSNAFTVTVSGSPSVQRFSPFNPTAPYAAGTDGGSGYFDGTGDYIQAADSASLSFSGDFTCEGWFYYTGTAASLVPSILTDSGTSAVSAFEINNGSTFLQLAGQVANNTINRTTFSGTVAPGVWTHIAYVRSSNVIRVYVNGVVSATTLSNSAATGRIRQVGDGRTSGLPFPGYISNFRLVGSAVYTSNFTPPTSPVTAITNTQLLCDFTNAGILDNAEMNNLETVGNAQISTAQSKFGGASMLFDGTGDYLDIPSNPNLTFGTGDFTLEFWMRTSGTDFNVMNPATATGSGYWGLLFQSSNLRWNSAYNVTNLIAVSATAILDNNWHHVAICRASGTTRVFYDGVSQTSQSDSTNYSGVAAWRIGSGNVAALNGYIDDLRITKGAARYIGNFTPPVARMPQQ